MWRNLPLELRQVTRLRVVILSVLLIVTFAILLSSVSLAGVPTGAAMISLVSMNSATVAFNVRRLWQAIENARLVMQQTQVALGDPTFLERYNHENEIPIKRDYTDSVSKQAQANIYQRLYVPTERIPASDT